MDTNDPRSLLNQLESLLSSAGIRPPYGYDSMRASVLKAWDDRLTPVTWDWKPAARHIQRWLESSYGYASVVWMNKRPGEPIQINFQMPSEWSTSRWSSSKFKTLRGQLDRKFGMTPSPSSENLYTLADGTKVSVDIFVGGTPGPDLL